MSIAAQINFGVAKKIPKNSFGIKDDVETYLGMLRKMGHLWGDSIISIHEKKVSAYVYLPRVDALDVKYFGFYLLQEHQKVVSIFQTQPKVKILDYPITRRFLWWQSAPFLYLFTHLFDTTSPVCRGHNGGAIPSYTLPISESDRESLQSWMRKYKNCDSLWIQSGCLEMSAYREMSDPKSDLSKEGRALCKKLEELTKKPTYYYLMRYYRENKKKTNDACPDCGQSWKKYENNPLQSGQFAFVCESCRLVANYPDET